MIPYEKRGFYNPVQPEFKIKAAHYVEQKEVDLKGSKHYLYYQFRTDQPSNSLMIIPDGCIDILFACGGKNLSGKVCGTVLQCKEIQLLPECEYFGIRLHPGKNITGLNNSMKDMIDCEFFLTDIIPAEADPTEQLAAANSFENRIKIFRETIGNHIFINKGSVSAAVQNALYNIYLRKGNITVNQLAEDSGYSTRYLRKKFEDDIGMSPKLFAQIIRFQYSLYMLMDGKNYSIWDIIEENGYYDQAHLINEYKKFGYCSPNQLISTISANTSLAI